MPKRVRRRSTTGSRSFTSAVLPGTHLRADRATFAIDHQRQDHLRQIRAGVLRVTTPAQHLAPRTDGAGHFADDDLASVRTHNQ